MQLAQHRVALRRLVSRQGVGPSALECSHDLVDLHSDEVGTARELVEVGTLARKKHLFLNAPYERLLGTLCGRKTLDINKRLDPF